MSLPYLLPLSSIIVFMNKQLGMMQEIAFFEEGEPMIDGEPGDLKVGKHSCVVWCCNALLLQLFFYEQQLGIFSVLD